MAAGLPASAMFKYEMSRASIPTITDMHGNVIDMVQYPPTFTISIRSPFDFLLKKFSQVALMQTSVSSSVSARGMSTTINTYRIGVIELFLEEYDRVYLWPKFSGEFDTLMEEELSKKTEDKV